MCGIAGIAGGTDLGAVDAALRRMAAAMTHRGPDDEGVDIVAREPLVGLCSRRLAIQDCSPLGHQPMRSERSGTRTALNGELYNVEELRAELASRGHRFAGRSDTEVALRAHDEWGEGCVERFRGMFSIAFWESNRHRLVLARDRLGIKPLYLRESSGSLVFASEVRALLASREVPAMASGAGLATFLAFGAVVEPLTLIDGVRCLAPGHIAVWENGRLRERPYWSLTAAFGQSDGGDREATVGRLREVLEEAVRQHLVSDVPLGVFLSGGIDSSALVGLVAEVADKPPRTVSAVFPQQRFSEERYIRTVRERFHTEHTQIELDDRAILGALPGALAAMDQPTFDGVNTYVVARLARESGLKVVLSGLGGDELFGGYDTFRVVPRLDAVRRFMPATAGAVVAPMVRAVTRSSDRGVKLASWLRGGDGRTSAYELRRELFSPDFRATLMPSTAEERVALPPTPPDPVNAVSVLELDVYMRNVLLRDSDVMSMAHGLELRVPLLDHRLVELVAAMPGRWKADRSKPKPLLVDALRGLLPDEVVHRRKMGFALPFVHWLHGPLRATVESSLLDPDYGGQVADLLDPGAVRTVWERFCEGRGLWTRPWALYVAKAWGERHLPR